MTESVPRPGSPADTSALRVGQMSARLGHAVVVIGGATTTATLALTALVEKYLTAMPLWGRMLLLVPVFYGALALCLLVARSLGREIDAVFAELTGAFRKVEPDGEAWQAGETLTAIAPELAAAAGQAVGRLTGEIETLRQVAYQDGATGLPNRQGLMMALAGCIPAASFAAPVGLMVLDLDGFERVQDTIGAEGSLQVVEQIAQRLARLTGTDGSGAMNRSDMLLARTGPDSFALVLRQGYTREQVAGFAESLRRVVREPVEAGGKMFSLALSGGIAMAPDDGDRPAELLRHAELALREVRAGGSPGLRFFTPRLNRLATGRIRFETELREAVERREFVAVFQPKIEFRSGGVKGAEALARWQRPGGKAISPATFIPLAEETGLINTIGRHILEQACEQAQGWHAAGHACSVAVNVSPRQFERDDFVGLVVDTLGRTGLPPRLLELEITESLAVDNPKRVAEIMRPLRAMGVRLAIDDFGSGHANLSMLTQLPFDVFKIDRQFVAALQTDRQAPAIVEMILAMAETLGLETVAEGVETPLQADFLRRRGCTMAQGFLFSPALPAEDFLSLLETWHTRETAGGRLRA